MSSGYPRAEQLTTDVIRRALRSGPRQAPGIERRHLDRLYELNDRLADAIELADRSAASVINASIPTRDLRRLYRIDDQAAANVVQGFQLAREKVAGDLTRRYQRTFGAGIEPTPGQVLAFIRSQDLLDALTSRQRVLSAESVRAVSNGLNGAAVEATLHADEIRQALATHFPLLSGDPFTSPPGLAEEVGIATALRDARQSIPADTFSQVHEELTAHALRGSGIPEMTRSLTPIFDGNARRAELTSRYATIRAYNFSAEAHYVDIQAQLEPYDRLIEKVWLSAEDERTCPICQALDGQVVSLGASFPIDDTGATPFPDPTVLATPPAHARCRCSIYARVSGVRRRRKREEEAEPQPSRIPTAAKVALGAAAGAAAAAAIVYAVRSGIAQDTAQRVLNATRRAIRAIFDAVHRALFQRFVVESLPEVGPGLAQLPPFVPEVIEGVIVPEPGVPVPVPLPVPVLTPVQAREVDDLVDRIITRHPPPAAPRQRPPEPAVPPAPVTPPVSPPDLPPEVELDPELLARTALRHALRELVRAGEDLSRAEVLQVALANARTAILESRVDLIQALEAHAEALMTLTRAPDYTGPSPDAILRALDDFHRDIDARLAELDTWFADVIASNVDPGLPPGLPPGPQREFQRRRGTAPTSPTNPDAIGITKRLAEGLARDGLGALRSVTTKLSRRTNELIVKNAKQAADQNIIAGVHDAHPAEAGLTTEMRQVDGFVTRVTGIDSVWNGKILVGKKIGPLARKDFSCAIIVNQELVGAPERFDVMLHENLHAHSLSGIAELEKGVRQYVRNLGWEEATVERFGRMLEDMIATDPQFATSNGLTDLIPWRSGVRSESSEVYDRYVEYLDLIQRDLGMDAAAFNFGLMRAPLSERSALVAGWAQAALDAGRITPEAFERISRARARLDKPKAVKREVRLDRPISFTEPAAEPNSADITELTDADDTFDTSDSTEAWAIRDGVPLTQT